MDKRFSETWATKEKLLQNDTDHEAVFLFQPGSTIHQEIGLLLLSALSRRKVSMTATALHGQLVAEFLQE